jgi:ATP-binding cassette, subfamily G (WHITE), member 2, PDR
MMLTNEDFVSSLASTGLSGRQVICSANELAVMQPPAGTSCGEYLGLFAKAVGGIIYNPNANSDCQYCTMSVADEFLAGSSISYSTRWRDYGLGFAYIVFNIFMAVFLYYLIRVRKSSGKTMEERFGWLLRFLKRDANEKSDTKP